MRYALGGHGYDKSKFWWIGADGSQLTITKNTISEWIVAQGKEYALSQIWSALNTALSNNIIDGYSKVEIEDDGTPENFEQQTTPYDEE